MTDLTDETARIVNRHMARLLTDLEEAQCPSIIRQAVKSALGWLRKDLTDMTGEYAERN